MQEKEFNLLDEPWIRVIPILTVMPRWSRRRKRSADAG